MAFDAYADLEEILLTKEQIAGRVAELGEEITACYGDESLLVIGVLKGGVVFFSDLIRHIRLDTQVDFIAVSSYGSSTSSSGEVRMVKDLDTPFEGRNVLILEDMLDTGLTLKYLTDIFRKRLPKTLRICAFMDKPERRKADIKADFVGFEVPDRFVVGYGLDYNERYRGLPDIGVLKPELYS